MKIPSALSDLAGTYAQLGRGGNTLYRIVGEGDVALGRGSSSYPQ